MPLNKETKPNKKLTLIRLVKLAYATWEKFSRNCAVDFIKGQRQSSGAMWTSSSVVKFRSCILWALDRSPVSYGIHCLWDQIRSRQLSSGCVYHAQYTHTHTHTHTHIYIYSYLPTSPLGQDTTQGQFLSGV